MLAIRMQRLGRKGRPTYRMVVQDSRQTPSSGKYVALLGSYDPHSKTTTLNKVKAEFYLNHGAQPSDRVVRILKEESVKLPKWIKNETSSRKRTTRNPEKLRKNQPKEEVSNEKPASEEAPAEVQAAKEEPVEPEKPEEAKTAKSAESSEETK